MAEEERHLSEVHLLSESNDGNANDLALARCSTTFVFALPYPAQSDEHDQPGSPQDSDGDLVPIRRSSKRMRSHGAIRVRHSLATTLPQVGMQVWRGALLMGDFLLEQSTALRNAVVLELGAGCGLSSLIASHVGAYVTFATDGASDHILSNTMANVQLNSAIADVCVRRLDWGAARLAEQWPQPLDFSVDDTQRQREVDATRFTFQSSDASLLRRCEWILAADCVYDDAATDALLETVERLLCGSPRLVAQGCAAYFALERRVCFCVDGMRARAPAAEHFVASLQARQARGTWQVERIPEESVPQRCEYERGNALELWRVTSSGNTATG